MNLLDFIKHLRCAHRKDPRLFVFVRNVYGDEINALDCRSIWKCRKCGAHRFVNELHREANP